MRRFLKVAGFVAALLISVQGLRASEENPCEDIPDSRRPPAGWTFEASVLSEWELIQKTVSEISRLHTGPHSEESTYLKYDLNRLPDGGPIAFKGRVGVRSRLFLYFPRGQLTCVVVQSRSRPGGSLWERAYFFVPIAPALRPALEYRGPGKSPFQAFERLDLKDQLGFLRQLHRNLRAARNFLERKRAAGSGSDQSDSHWSLAP